jgi:hypothetical protein
VRGLGTYKRNRPSLRAMFAGRRLTLRRSARRLLGATRLGTRSLRGRNSVRVERSRAETSVPNTHVAHPWADRRSRRAENLRTHRDACARGPPRAAPTRPLSAALTLARRRC